MRRDHGLDLQHPAPQERPGELFDARITAWPSYAAYVASFLRIGVMWVNHHALFERLAHVDRTTVFINPLLLMSIVFLPFATAQLGENILCVPLGQVSPIAVVILLIAVATYYMFERLPDMKRKAQ